MYAIVSSICAFDTRRISAGESVNTVSASSADVSAGASVNDIAVVIASVGSVFFGSSSLFPQEQSKSARDIAASDDNILCFIFLPPKMSFT